jgi:PTH1 family peptidyl-tRNA hydrolase
MPTPIQLIVGLGNPGNKYANTRHNAGAWLVENIASASNLSLRTEGKFQGAYARANFSGQECHLLIPNTYMNLSGISVKAVANFYKIPVEAILIIHDEIDIPPGIVRLKFDGGAGGHNGLTDIIAHLQSRAFHRLRIGVGRPAAGEDVADFVLSPPSKPERQLIDDASKEAEAVLPLILTGDMAQAMQKLHTQT